MDGKQRSEPIQSAAASAIRQPGQQAATLAEISALFNQAVALHQAGRVRDAEPLYRAVLAAQPSHFEGLRLLGFLHYQHGEHAETVRLVDLALAVNSNVPELHNLRGAALKELNRPQEALVSYGHAIALDPNYADAHYNRGNVLKEQRCFAEALAAYDRAIALRPDHVETLNNRGTALRALKRFPEALESFDRVIALDSANALAHYNRGNVLDAMKRFEEAIASYDQAVALCGDDPRAWNNRGNSLSALGRFEEALASYDRAIMLLPDYADAFTNRANALMNLKRLDEALASYDRAIALKPEYAEAHWNRGLCRLLIDHRLEGWADYEWRWKTEQLAPERREFKQAQWFGDADITGRTILLHAEQGFGDAIMAARYIRCVIEQGARVIVEAPAALQPLLAEIEGVAQGAAQVVIKGSPLPAFDLHCPLMSLPLAFRTTLSTIPAQSPYLSVPKTHAAKWLQRLPRAATPRVGISWAGNPSFKHDDWRSIGLRNMLPLLARTDVQFVSLQKFLRDGDADILRAHPHILHLGDEIETFADTAAIMSTLDLVISSDTAIVHLAGALGRPLWILLAFVPDWRWLLDRNDSPWYPTARLFRQSRHGDWQGVVAELVRELSALQRSPGATRNSGEVEPKFH
jgi:tetratricopeptide (TPR) repeat protein